MSGAKDRAGGGAPGRGGDIAAEGPLLLRRSSDPLDTGTGTRQALLGWDT